MGHYLVTGTAGFIGARVAEMLLEQGHTVVGVDNLNAAYDVRIKEYRLRRLQSLPGFTFQKIDISDRHAVEGSNMQPSNPSGRVLRRGSGQASGRGLPTFNAVINLAARAGVRASVEDPWAFVETNVLGTLNLLELCRQRGIGKFILASTSSIYGANAPLPTPESADSDHPLQPYAASKKSAEALSHSYHSLYGLDVSVVRYFTVYGPAGRPDMSMFRFAKWISEGQPLHLYGSGEQSRGFTYVDDIAGGTIAALEPLGYEIINLGGHEAITMNGLIEMLEEVIGKPANIQRHPPNPADMLTNWADVSKARRLLGWQPQVGLREGVGRLVDWYRAERAWAKEVATL
ncbi:MAG: GDP-mannose 4,6-dehydratase [Anaerolineales bacterium]|nr:GDP-mannose 4,6-dehydratase [Anaerolineales bacterium]